jgi:hypothetical protein
MEKREIMKVLDMSKKEFENLRLREWSEDIGKFNSIIILPGKSRPLHDSGFRYMDFIAVKNHEAICRLSGCSDVLHLDGIGGYGRNKTSLETRLTTVKAWNIDCLPKSGLLHMWCEGYELEASPAFSSFEIIAYKI